MKQLIFVHETGPLVEYDNQEEVLYIEDLNPQIKIKWRMSRGEILDMADKLVKAARK